MTASVGLPVDLKLGLAGFLELRPVYLFFQAWQAIGTTPEKE